MTYYTFIKELEEEFLNEPNVRYVGYPDIYQLNSLPDLKYAIGYITPGTSRITDGFITFNLNLYYVDR